MPRIAGINIPENKQIWISLTYVYGIGRSLSMEILKKAKIDFNIKASQLNAEQINLLRELIEKNFKIEGDLRRERMRDIKRLKDVGCWRGLRHIKKLPARGQRTKRNTRTIRGNVRKTVGSGKKSSTSTT